jgi:uncharacterized protein YyaL (SSP411 family)
MTKAQRSKVPPPGFNRLVFEKSPYLLQHSRNPVDWYPWGEEALERARREDRPIFLSIGYSTCHWCHVMERESFENREIAELLRADFVSIKLDREERPDLDDHFMEAVVALTGAGGWPMTLFLAPDLRILFGGTYFPPMDGFRGRPGFASILRTLARLWREDRPRLLERGAELAGHLDRDRPPPPEGTGKNIDAGLLDTAVADFHRRFDSERGGFGGAPKFPPHLALDFFLRHFHRTGDPRARTMLERTLDAMAAGGIHDQIGGGFHRYSTDAIWLVPHFEKMLSDNALLAKLYLEAGAALGRPDWLEVGRSALAWMEREMRCPEGGFASARDADDPGGEGSYYTWTPEQLAALLGSGPAAIVAERFGVRAEGNFAAEPAGFDANGADGRATILSIVAGIDEVARRASIEPGQAERILSEAAARMLRARASRPAPAIDDKVLVDWNGLALSAFAAGRRILGEERWERNGRRAADFLLDRMWDGNRLLHRWRDGEGAIDGFLTDYAFFARGLLDLFEASFEPRYLRAAAAIGETMICRFRDPDGGDLLLTAEAGEIGRRIREDFDGAIPTGGSVAVLFLERLAAITEDSRFAEAAAAVVRSRASVWTRRPTALAGLLSAAELQESEPVEIVLGGEPGEESFERLRGALTGRYLPSAVLMHADSSGSLESLSPLVVGKRAGNAGARAWVCRGRSCSPPVDGPDALAAALPPGRGTLSPPPSK